MTVSPLDLKRDRLLTRLELQFALYDSDAVLSAIDGVMPGNRYSKFVDGTPLDDSDRVFIIQNLLRANIIANEDNED